MDVAGFVADSVANVADVLVALVAVRTRALAHRVQQNMRTTMRTAEGRGVHLLAFADEFGRITKVARLFWRQPWRGTMVHHQLAVVGGFKEGHYGPSNT